MKKIKVLIMILSIPLFFACEDISFLNKAPYSQTSPENFYKRLSDFESAIVGCYDAISLARISSVNVTMGTYFQGLPFILSGGNDELILSNNPGTNDITAFAQGAYISQNSAILNLWTAYFAGIMRCNYIIERAKIVSLNEEQFRLNEIVAEAHFLRGFFYLHLVQLFGGIPINKAEVADAYAPRQSVKNVFENVIIPDFDYAYKNLPNRAKVLGAANKWSASGYLATVYNYLATCKRYNVGGTLQNNDLNKFDWVDENRLTIEAKILLEDIILNSGYKTIERYDCLFREATKSLQQQECLFTVENALTTIQDEHPQGTSLFAPGNSSRGGSYGIYRASVELWDKYQSTGIDVRRNHNLTGNYNAQTEMIEGEMYSLVDAGTRESTGGNFPGKYRIREVKSRPLTANRHGVSIPLLRYADILLQYAEVCYFTGDEQTARNMLTQVRKRALADGYSIEELNAAYYKDNFIEELLDERSRELCFESKRRIDLIRFGKLTNIIEAIDLGIGGNIQYAKTLKENWLENKIWLPIPQSECDMNKKLTQNYGY